VFRVTACLENLEMSGNLTAVRQMSGTLLKVREMAGNKIMSGKICLKFYCLLFDVYCKLHICVHTGI